MGLSLRRDACEDGRDDPVHLLLRGRVVGAREQHVRAADQGQRELRERLKAALDAADVKAPPIGPFGGPLGGPP